MLTRVPAIGVNWGHPLNQGLVSWHLAAMTGRRGAWQNLVAGGVTGTLTNTPTWAAPGRPGALGGVTVAAASSQVVDCGTSSALDSLFSSTQPSTVMCWVYLATLPGAWTGLVTKGRDGATWWGLWISNGNQWHVAPDLIQGSVTVGWHHVVGTGLWNTSAPVTLYVDGVAVGSPATSSSRANSNSLWIGGAKGVSEYLTGSLDDVRIFRRQFSADQVWRVYTLSRQGNPGLLTGIPRYVGSPGITARPWHYQRLMAA